MKPSKPIFVTGATGSIGSALVKRLAESGHWVRVLVRNPQKTSVLQGIANLEFFPGDLDRPESLRGCAEGCSLVYHCAAKLPSSSWTGSYTTNVRGSQAIIDEVTRTGIERLIYTSTIGVYGLSKAETITEETPWSKFNQPYFATKQEAEQIIWQVRDRIPLTIARLGDVIGPGQYTWTIDLVKKMNQGLLQPPLEREAGFLNPIYIDNLIDALVLLGTHPAACGEIFNVVDGTPIRVGDYFRRLAQMGGKPVVPLPSIVLKGAALFLMRFDLLRGREPGISPGELNYLLRRGKIYPDKLQSLLGWKPAISQEEAFSRTEQWLRQGGYL